MFSQEATPDLIQECLKRSEYDLIKTIAVKKSIDLNRIMMEWSMRGGTWTKKDIGFGLHMMGYISDVPTYLRRLLSNIGSQRIELSLHDLIRLDRAYRTYQLPHDRSIEIEAIERALAQEVIVFINRRLYKPVFLPGATPDQLVAYLNDLCDNFLAHGENEGDIRQLIFGEKLNASFHVCKIFLEAALEVPSCSRSEKLIQWVSQASGLVFPNMIRTPMIEQRIRENRHPIVQILCTINGLEFSSIKNVMDKCGSFHTVNDNKQTELEAAMLNHRFDVATELLERGMRLSTDKSYFNYNISKEFLEYLHLCKIVVRLSKNDIEKLLTQCTPSLYTEAKRLYPQISLDVTFDLFHAYCYSENLGKEPIDPELWEKIENQLQVLENHYVIHPVSEKIVEDFSRVAVYSPSTFLNLVELCPSIYAKLDKTALVDHLITYCVGGIDHSLILELDKGGVQWTAQRILNVCLKYGYRKGFLVKLLENRPDLRHFVSEAIKNSATFNFTFPFVTYELLEDLYELFAEECKTSLLMFMVYLINNRDLMNCVNHLFHLFASKKNDPHFLSFFHANHRRSPLLTLSVYNISQLSKASLDCLKKVGNYQSIFDTNYEFMYKLTQNNRYDLYIHYLEIDSSIFNRRNTYVTIGFLLYSLGELIYQQAMMHRHEVWKYLGIDGVLALRKLKFDINITPDILFKTLKNLREAYRVDRMVKIDQNDIDSFKLHLEETNAQGRTPLLECAAIGRTRFMVYLLQMGSSVFAQTAQGENFFDLFFNSYRNNKIAVLNLLYTSGIKCTHLLVENNYSALKKALRYGTDDEVALVFKIYLKDPHNIGEFLEQIGELSPGHLKILVPLLPPGVLSKLSVQAARVIYQKGLVGATKVQKIQFTEKMLQEIRPEFLFEVALLDEELSLSQLFVQKYKIELNSYAHILNQCSINKLLAWDLLEIARPRIEVQVNFIRDLQRFGLLRKSVDTKFLYDLKQRTAHGIGEGFEGIVSCYYKFNPAFYQLPVIVAKVPPNADTTKYKNFVQIFDTVVPQEFVGREEEVPYGAVSRATLRKRLVTLTNCIENKTPFIGVPKDNRVGFYNKLANQFSYIYDFITEKKDAELTRQVVVRIANGGPDDHCGTRWEDLALFYMNHLGPKLAPSNLSEWILSLLNQYRVGCFDALIEKLGGTSDAYMPHERRKALFFLEKQGIKFYGTTDPADDLLSRSVKEDSVNATFKATHTTGGAYGIVCNAINHQILGESEVEWIKWTIKSDYKRFGDDRDLAYYGLIEMDEDGELLFFDLSGKPVPLGTVGGVMHYKPLVPVFLLHFLNVLSEK